MKLRLRKSPDFSNYQNRDLSSYDIIGDIAIIRVPSNRLSNSREIENYSHSIINSHKNIKTVLLQSGSIEGRFRLRKLDYMLGENKTYTIHKENNCLFSVDVEKCYFSPRLSHERNRILHQVKPNEIIVNMFSGVGCFSILIAKWVESAKVYSIDINPIAIDFMKKNVRLNRVYNKVLPLTGDAKVILENKLQGVADRVLMPLPEKAFEYLSSALFSLKKSGGWIHYYDFEHAKKNESPVEKTKSRVNQKLSSLGVYFDIPTSRIVRSIGPNWYQVVLDIKILNNPDRF
jgi:tRNA (guanine37-N1)-methyltransferase